MKMRVFLGFALAIIVGSFIAGCASTEEAMNAIAKEGTNKDSSNKAMKEAGE